MKKLSLLLPITGFLAYLTLTSSSTGMIGQSTVGCGGGSCHGGSASTATQLTISHNIPAAGWTPGSTYTITVSVGNASQARAGFNLSATSGGTNLGTLSNPGAGAQIVNSELTHNAPKVFTSGSASWTCSWTAPPAASTANSVTFSLAGNAVNFNTQPTGDVWNITSTSVQKAVSIPAAPTITSSGPTTICAGGTFPTLTASSAGASSYTWFTGATQVATGASYTPTAGGSYTATATNTAGTSTASSPTTVTVNPNPVITAIQSDNTLCPGQCDTITLSSTVANTSYAFTIAGGGSGTGTGNRIVFCLPQPPNNPTAPQVMTITGTAAGTNCQGTSTQTITPNPLPSAAFTFVPLGLTYNFTGPTGTGLTYAWNFGNGQTSTLQNPSVTYATGGSYTVTLTVTSGQTGCGATTTQTVLATTSIAGVVGLQGFRFGPNPAQRTLTLHTGDLKVDVRLLDLSGKVIATLRTRGEVSKEKSISLAHLSAGLYFLEVTTQNTRGVEKLIVR